MPTARTIARIEKLVWVLAYGGLILVVLGIATGRTDPVIGWWLAIPGALLALAGFVLIPLRARMHAPPADGAQSKPKPTETP